MNANATPAGDNRATDYVFVSYSDRDWKVVSQIVERFAEAGVGSWTARLNLPPGSNFADRIPPAINQSFAVVMLITRSAIASENVKDELLHATDHRKLIYPLRRETFDLRGAFELQLRGKQWIDASDLDSAMTHLIAALKGAGLKTGPAQPPPPPWWPKAAIAAIALAAVVLTTYYLLTRPPKWSPLPAGADFVNRSDHDIDLHPTWDQASPSLGAIRPNTHLFLSGVSARLESATVAGRTWLRYRDGPEGADKLCDGQGCVYVLREGLCPVNLVGRMQGC